MTDAYQRFREICLSLPETSEVVVEAWGHPTFRLGTKLKMFASCSSPDADRPSLGMKVEKAHQQALVQTDPRFVVAAYVGKHGWVTFDASGAVEWNLVRELVLERYVLNAQTSGQTSRARSITDVCAIRRLFCVVQGGACAALASRTCSAG